MPQGLDELFSARALKTDPDSLAQWGCDWTRSFTVAPSAVVFPETVEEVVALVRLANEAAFALVPSGGRTGCRAVLWPATARWWCLSIG